MYLSTLLIDAGKDPDRIRPGRNWLRNVYRVHQRLSMAFPAPARKTTDPQFLQPFRPEDFGEHLHIPRSGQAGFLFRIDPQPGGNPVILVQSAIEPDWDYAFHNADYLLAAPPEVRSWNPVFQSGQRYRFRLMANATRKVGTLTAAQRRENPDSVILEPPGDLSGPWRRDRRTRNGTRVPVPREQLPDWLIRRGETGGFKVVPGPEALNIQVNYYYVNRAGFANANGSEQPGRACIPQLFCARYEGLLEVTDPRAFYATIASGIGPARAFGCGLLTIAKP
ncbi:MAG TPA: type I-E CRISPR-associated protein Cas6/Cse3/CasE [Candidatus Hydrogenedentes bacterium]|nr:type I-E CRISPR-associated protein Cas6/Cse3/CasE [Candidatus Hydrogenedentota bacterium]